MSRLQQFLFLMFVLCMSLAYLSVQAHLVNRSFLLDMKRGGVEILRAERDRLEVLISQATSLDRIEDIATQQLGMIRPDETMFLTSGEDRISQQPETDRPLTLSARNRESNR